MQSVKNGSPPVKQCSDNSGDRTLGAYWEDRFCDLAAQNGRSFTRHQQHKTSSSAVFLVGGRHHQLPDVTIWSAPVEHHEIKHKKPNQHDSIGLEEYRWESLRRFAAETRQMVMYTIHRHDLAGGRDCKQNDISHWFTISTKRLSKLIEHDMCKSFQGYSWINGEKRLTTMLYWPVSEWKPLADFWGAHTLN